MTSENDLNERAVNGPAICVVEVYDHEALRHRYSEATKPATRKIERRVWADSGPSSWTACGRLRTFDTLAQIVDNRIQRLSRADVTLRTPCIAVDTVTDQDDAKKT